MEAIAEVIKISSELSVRMRAPGTCGELIQGYIDGQDFLINCPIDLYASARVSQAQQAGLHLEQPQQFRKIRDVAMLVAQEAFLELKHTMAIHSEIPRGKGMASSTADITAALAAICRSCDFPLNNEVFAKFITEIEPSDCVHFPGIAHVNHLTGELFESLPAPCNLKVLIFDCGGEVDTISFDRQRARAVYLRNTDTIRGAVDLLKRGLRTNNLQWVSEAATRSAELSQKIHFKPQFSELLAVAQSVGALGVNCAHSGSVLGVLYQTSEHLKENLLMAISSALGSGVDFIGDFHIIGGGYGEY